MNPLMNLIGNAGRTGANNGNLLTQAIGAMIRGENPRTFLQNLVNTNPAFSGVDVNNIQASAQRACQQKGVNMGQAVAQAQNIINANKK